MVKPSIAVVGCGYWGKNLIRNFSQLGGLYAVCDENQLLAKSFAEQHSVTNMPWAELLEDTTCQGVVLALPAELHAEFAIQALEKNKHVYLLH